MSASLMTRGGKKAYDVGPSRQGQHASQVSVHSAPVLHLTVKEHRPENENAVQALIA